MANGDLYENCRSRMQTGATDEGQVGECHPYLVLTGSLVDSKMGFAIWPSTLEDNWCGPFEARTMANEKRLERMDIFEQMEQGRKKR